MANRAKPHAVKMIGALAVLWTLFTSGAGSPQPQGQDLLPADEVLAEIDGYQLTRSELDQILQVLPQAIREKFDTPEGRANFIRNYIQQKAMAREALALKLDQEQAVQLEMRMNEEQVLAEAFRSRALQQIQVSDEEVEDFYEQKKDLFMRPVMVKLNRILVGNQKEAEQVVAELRSGKSFAELAASHSKDIRSKDRGGFVGWIQPGQMEPAVEQAAFGLEPGQIAPPVRTVQGWQILQVTKRDEAGYLPLDRVRETIRSRLLDEKRKQAVQSIAQQAFDKYGGKVYTAGRQP